MVGEREIFINQQEITTLTDGWWYSPATTVLLVTWQATLKPYKHQITHLGRVDIVISAEKILFMLGKSQRGRGKNPTGGPRPYLPTPACCPPKQKVSTRAKARIWRDLRFNFTDVLLGTS